MAVPGSAVGLATACATGPGPNTLNTGFSHVLFYARATRKKHPSLTRLQIGNFRENFSFANSAKRPIGGVQTSRLMHDLPISVNDRVILPFSRVSRK